MSYEETLGCRTSTPCLKVHNNYFTILINCSPKTVLPAVDLHKDFIDVESIPITPMSPLGFGQLSCQDPLNR